MSNLYDCTSNATMCCWPKDRQANNGNGNSDKDVADNTKDLQAGDASSCFDSASGFDLYPEDNNNGEGAIHCHGFACADYEYETTARY